MELKMRGALSNPTIKTKTKATEVHSKAQEDEKEMTSLDLGL